MSLIMATHAAPAVQGVTRVGLGIILELISLSTHELHEAGQLVGESEWVKMRTHPHPSPSAPADRDYHLFMCPCQWVLLCSKLGERKEDFDVVFFSFN